MEAVSQQVPCRPRIMKQKLMHLAGICLDPIGKVISIMGSPNTHVTALSAPVQSCAVNLDTSEIRLTFPSNTCVGVTESFRCGHLAESLRITRNNWVPINAILWSKEAGWQVKFDDNKLAAIKVDFDPE